MPVARLLNLLMLVLVVFCVFLGTLWWVALVYNAPVDVQFVLFLAIVHQHPLVVYVSWDTTYHNNKIQHVNLALRCVPHVLMQLYVHHAYLDISSTLTSLVRFNVHTHVLHVRLLNPTHVFLVWLGMFTTLHLYKTASLLFNVIYYLIARYVPLDTSLQSTTHPRHVHNAPLVPTAQDVHPPPYQHALVATLVHSSTVNLSVQLVLQDAQYVSTPILVSLVRLDMLVTYHIRHRLCKKVHRINRYYVMLVCRLVHHV